MAESKKYEIAVRALPQYVGAQSAPEEDRYVFAYTITIENTGTVAAQLISRHWIIRDLDNNVHEVEGEGVLGEQPVIAPGQTYEYMSGTSLESPVGTMHGTYQMRSEDGTEFDALIPEFLLSVPRTLH